MLEKVGIVIRIQSMDFGTFFDQIKSGQFQLYSLTWTGLVEPDILYYAFAKASVPPNGANRGLFDDALISKWTTAARQTLDHSLRKKLYADAQNRLAILRPYAVLWDQDLIVIRNKRIPKVAPYPDGNWRWLDEISWEN